GPTGAPLNRRISPPALPVRRIAFLLSSRLRVSPGSSIRDTSVVPSTSIKDTHVGSEASSSRRDTLPGVTRASVFGTSAAFTETDTVRDCAVAGAAAGGGDDGFGADGAELA